MMTKTIAPTWDEIEKRTDIDALIIKKCIKELRYSWQFDCCYLDDIYKQITNDF